MSCFWIKQINSIIYTIKRIKKVLQIIMTKINSILTEKRKEILFIIKLLEPKINIINISISYELNAIIIYIILTYALFIKKKK